MFVRPVCAQLTLTPLSDMGFGGIEFATVHNGTVRLATNGTATTTGSGLTTFGSATAGEVEAEGDGSSTIEIRCDTGGTVAETGGDTIALQNAEVAINTGVIFGAGDGCNGSGMGDAPATTHDLGVDNRPNILIGIELDASGSGIATSALYSSATAGGSPVTLSIVVQ